MVGGRACTTLYSTACYGGGARRAVAPLPTMTAVGGRRRISRRAERGFYHTSGQWYSTSFKQLGFPGFPTTTTTSTTSTTSTTPAARGPQPKSNTRMMIAHTHHQADDEITIIMMILSNHLGGARARPRAALLLSRSRRRRGRSAPRPSRQQPP